MALRVWTCEAEGDGGLQGKEDGVASGAERKPKLSLRRAVPREGVDREAGLSVSLATLGNMPFKFLRSHQQPLHVGGGGGFGLEGQCVHILPGGMLEARLGCAPAAGCHVGCVHPERTNQ